MGRKKKEENVVDFFSQLTDLDPVAFIENNLTINGNPYKLTDCGREYLHEILRYIVFDSIRDNPNAMPVVVVKGRQVELTTTATALTLYFSCAMEEFTHITGIHAFPQIEQARRHSKKIFDEKVRESRNNKLEKMKEVGTGKSGNYSVVHKDFRRYIGDDYYLNTLYIDGTGPTGDRLRGIRADYILFDEIQDLPKQAYDTLTESLSRSQFGPIGGGLSLMFGTPKDKNSAFYKFWRHSDQRIYHLKCPHCGHLFPITLKNYIGGNGGNDVVCLDDTNTGCRKVFNKVEGIREGEWLPTNNGTDPLSGQPDPDRRVIYRGYHISQLLIPDITRDAIDRKMVEKGPREFANEVMGEFYSGMTEALGYDDVVRYTSTEPDSTTWQFVPYITGRQTWMGIDWGARISGEDDSGKGGYTVVTIISALQGGKFKLEYAYRMETDKRDEQLRIISDLIRKYNVQIIAADHGFGYSEIQRLQEEWGTKVKAVFSASNTKKVYSYSEDVGMPMITIDKAKVMEEFFDFMKHYGFCFPWGDYEKLEWLAAHISNVEVKSKVVGGMTRKYFDKQSAEKPIDGLMSLVYAYVAYTYSKTRGFVNTQMNNFNNSGYGRSMVAPMLVKMPKPRRS